MMRSWGCGSGWSGFGHMSGWMGSGFSYLTIALVVILLVVVYLAFRNNHRSKPQSSALTILDEQYAMGKINEDEYLKRKKTLEK